MVQVTRGSMQARYRQLRQYPQQADISKTTAGNLNLDAGRGDSEIHLAGDVTHLNGNLTFEDGS